MLKWAVDECTGPVAVRYPRGGEIGQTDKVWTTPEDGILCHRSGNTVTLVTYGSIFFNVEQAADELEKDGIAATVLRFTDVSFFDAKRIAEYIPTDSAVIVVEETCSGCGIREALSWALHTVNPHISVYGMDLGRGFVTHGKISQLYRHCGIDTDSIVRKTKEVLRCEN